MSTNEEKKGGWREVAVEIRDSSDLSFLINLGAHKPNGERAIELELPALQHIVRATLEGAGVEIADPIELTQVTTVMDYQGNITGCQRVDASNPSGEWIPASNQ